MKISNPTVFLDSNGELRCLTEVLPDPEGRMRPLDGIISRAKSSAVRVKNESEIMGIGAHSEIIHFPDETLHTLNGYEAEVSEEPEYPIDHTSYPPMIKVATITPIHKEHYEQFHYPELEKKVDAIHKEEESQEALWTEVREKLINFFTEHEANMYRMPTPISFDIINFLKQEGFTITRKQN